MVVLTPVKSQMIAAFGYDAPTQTLAVRFSPGKGVNALIRCKFEHTVVLDEPQEA